MKGAIPRSTQREIRSQLAAIAAEGLCSAQPVFEAARLVGMRMSVLRFHRDNCSRRFAAEACPECAEQRLAYTGNGITPTYHEIEIALARIETDRPRRATGSVPQGMRAGKAPPSTGVTQ